jgi:adenine-specific DNA-methyltransferase
MDRSQAKKSSKAKAFSLQVSRVGPKSSSKAILDKDFALSVGDTERFLAGLPKEPLFDLIVSSPPYNIGKAYEKRNTLKEYLAWQERIIIELVARLKPSGSLCWQIGNFVDNGHIVPLDIAFAPIFYAQGLKMRNRIIWHFGHGLHSQRRFSGRYEVVLWFTKGEDYVFNLDAVRVKAKYPGKRHFKGPNVGKLSGNPLGKNPEDIWAQSADVWSIPNVKANHIEKTQHPCQFPVGLIERLVLALTNEGDLVFDPFAGVCSAGVAAAIHRRRFWGCELSKDYAKVGIKRLKEAVAGKATYRPHDKPLYDHTKSKLSRVPKGWLKKRNPRAK